MILHFSQEFQRYTNGQESLELSGKTVGECVGKAFDIYPQLYVHLMRGKAEVARASIFRLNEEYIYDMEDCRIEVGTDDQLYLSMEVPAGEQKAFQYIMGAVQIIIGAVLLYYGNPAGIGMIMSGIGTILSAAGVFDPPAMEQMNAGLTPSNSITFSGIKNTTASGTPLPVIYGTHRIGGQLLNVYTRNSSFSKTIFNGATYTDIILNQDILYAQIGLCEGEIESVTEIEINKLPEYYYNALAYDVRLGTANQTTLGDTLVYPADPADLRMMQNVFDSTENTVPILRKILHGEATGGGTITHTDQPVYGYRADNGAVIGGFFKYEWVQDFGDNRGDGGGGDGGGDGGGGGSGDSGGSC